MTRRRTIAVVLWAIVMAGASVIPGFLGGAVAPFARDDFAISDVAVGTAFSGFWLFGALTAAPSARLTRRIGVLQVLRLAGLVLIVTSAATATFARDELSFVILVSLGGFAPALAVPAASIVIMTVVSPRHQAFALTSASASSAIGLLGAGFLVSVLARSLGWSAMYGLAATLGAVLLVAGIWLRSGAVAPPPGARATAKPPARRGPLIIALLAVCLANIATGAAATFIVSAAPTSGVGIEDAALAAAIASTLSIPVRMLLGIWTDRRGNDPLTLVAVLIAFGGFGYFLLGVGEPVAFIIGVALVLVPGWVWVNLFLYAILARYRADVAPVVGMVQTTFFVGSVIGPMAVGVLIALTSFSLSWFVLAGAVIVGAIALVAARSLLPRFENGHDVRAPATDALPS